MPGGEIKHASSTTEPTTLGGWLAFLMALLTCVGCTQTKDGIPARIQFDLGKHIAETAKASGAPGYSVRDFHGFISYGIHDLPPTVTVKFNRDGHEVEVPSLFAFTMYANEGNRRDDVVTIAHLQVSSKAARSHEAGRAYLDGLIQQFSKGRWKRHIADECPALTGRSVYLDESGALDASNICPLDPSYRIDPADWLELYKSPQYYTWTGDGVFAMLTASYTEDIRGLVYHVDIEFHDLATKTRQDEERLAKRLSEGDREGWNSTAEHIADMEKRTARNKVLERNAVRRGDPLFKSA